MILTIIEVLLLALIIWAGYGGLKLYRLIVAAVEAGLRMVRETAAAQTQALTNFAAIHTTALTEATKAHGDVLDMIAHTHATGSGSLALSAERLMCSIDSFHNATTQLANAAHSLMQSSDVFDDMRRDLSDLRKWQCGDKFRS